MNKKKFSVKLLVISVLAALLVTGIVVGLPKILNFAGYVIWLLAPFIVAYLVSLFVNPMADGLQKRFRLPRGISAILVIVLTVGVIGGIAAGIVWKIVDEIRNIYNDFPIIYQSIQDTWYSLSDMLSDVMVMLPQNIQETVDEFSNQFLDWIAGFAKDFKFVQTAGNAAKKVPNIFITTIVFLISLYFMVADSKSVAEVIRKPFNKEFLERLSNLKGEIRRYIGGYVRAQLTIMCISFTILLIGLSVLKINYALVVALATAALDALPFFGSGAVLLPWAVISFVMGDVARGIGLLIIYLTLILMRQLIEPKIVSKNIGMHPLLTLMAMYVGYRAFSIGGMILGPLSLVLIVSLYRVGVFDGVILTSKKVLAKFAALIKKIKLSLDNEGEE